MELQQKTKTDTNGLIPPYGGELKNLIIKDENLKNDLISKATYEFECSERNACDVELLMVGAFSPLEGFCLLYTSPSPRDPSISRMPSSA